MQYFSTMVSSILVFCIGGIGLELRDFDPIASQGWNDCGLECFLLMPAEPKLARIASRRNGNRYLLRNAP